MKPAIALRLPHVLHLWAISVFLLCSPHVSGQASTERGYLPIRNYTPNEYGAITQNWAIVQDGRGVMYFGNNGGVLEFDGINWRLIEIPNETNVRSLAADSMGTVFVGAQGEFGYLSPDSTGEMKYRSLLEQLNEKDRDFDNVWKIFAVDEGVYFLTDSKIFFWDGKGIRVTTSKTAFQLYELNGAIYLLQSGIGLTRIQGNKQIIVKEWKDIGERHITDILPFQKNSVLLVTERSGLFTTTLGEQDSSELHPFKTEIDRFLHQNNVENGVALKNGNISIGSTGEGIIALDKTGSLIQAVNKAVGLQDGSVHCQYEDRQGNLWVALNKGISKIDINAAVTSFSGSAVLQGTIKSIVRYDGRLYFATNRGVYYLSMEAAKENGASQLAGYEFKRLPDINTECWDLVAYREGDEQLLLAATNKGIYEVDRMNQSRLILKCDPWCLYQSRYNPRRVYVGLEGTLSSLYREKGKWIDEGVMDEIVESIYAVSEDENGNLWLGTRRNEGILKMNIVWLQGTKIGNTEVVRYDSANGLPEGLAFVHPSSYGTLFSTSYGLYKFIEEESRFVPDSMLGIRFADGSMGIHRLSEDHEGNIWLVAFTNVGEAIEIGFAKRVDEPGGFIWEHTAFSEISREIKHAIYHDSDGVSWLGGPDGLYRYDAKVQKNYGLEYHTLIRQVTIGEDSVIFKGSFRDKNANVSSSQTSLFMPVMSYANNSISFLYSATSFEGTNPNQFSYLLEGFDKSWSNWKEESKAVFTNLSEGAYTFRVKARNVYGKEGMESSYQFTILSPWYRTWWAYTLYVLLFAGLVFAVVYLNIRRLVAAKRRLEKLVKERTRELVEKNIELDKLSIVARETDNYVIISDAEDKIEWVNEGFTRITGYGFEEVLGKTPASVLRGEFTDEEDAQRIDAALKNKKAITAEILNYTRDNVPIWLYTNVTPVLNDKGAITRIVAVGSDITEKKKTEEQIKQQNIELEKLSIVASETDNSVFIMNEKCELEWANQAFTRLQGFTFEEFIKERGNTLYEISGNPEIENIVKKLIKEKTSYSYESCNINKSNEEIWLQTTLTPIFDEDKNLKKIVAIDSDITDIKKAEEEIRLKNQEITDSINYAQNIQQAILPLNEALKKMLPNHFVLFKPKDIVSGDFYWATPVDRTAYFCAADCTGHGVPGAFMSMICSSLLSEAVKGKGITQPAAIFYEVRKRLIAHLQQTGEGQKDGMDAIICAFTKAEKPGAKSTLSFACAHNPLFILRQSSKGNLSLESSLNGESQVSELAPAVEEHGLSLFEIKADKQPVGFLFGEQNPFTNHEVLLDEGDMIYAMSDGFQDQFGGPKGKKFMVKRLKSLLMEIGAEDLEIQKERLSSALEEWKSNPNQPDGHAEQVDDVLVIGVRV